MGTLALLNSSVQSYLINSLMPQ